MLIEPPFYRLFKSTYVLPRYPLSLGYLAAVVRKETDWEVMVYNADFTPQYEEQKMRYLAGKGFYNYLGNLKDLTKPIWEEVRSVILEYRPSVLGISSKSQNYTSACIIARFAKKIDKETVVIVGGTHPSCVGAEVLSCPDIDICVKGEGEYTLVELLNAINTQKGLDGIKGIAFRRNGQIVENPPREFIAELDSLPFPHENAPYVLKNYEQYPPETFQYIFAIRGCHYNCFFCASRKVWTRQVRFRSPKNVIAEIKGLQEKGVKSITFDDDTFGVTKEYTKELCNSLIKDCPGLKWRCQMHVNLVDEEVISIMKNAGCFSIAIGIESGNNEILQKMRKGFSIEDALHACEIVMKHKINSATYFMGGFPEETEDTLNDTITAMKKLKGVGLSYSIFTPYPGTESFEFCRKNGLIGDDYDVSLYNHQSPENSFCINIAPERFRALSSKIERMVDRRYWLNNIRQSISFETISKIKKKGVVRSIKSATRVLLNK